MQTRWTLFREFPLFSESPPNANSCSSLFLALKMWSATSWGYVRLDGASAPQPSPELWLYTQHSWRHLKHWSKTRQWGVRHGPRSPDCTSKQKKQWHILAWCAARCFSGLLRQWLEVCRAKLPLLVQRWSASAFFSNTWGRHFGRTIFLSSSLTE